jgi:cyclohexa-1,5-dienecarbonyl-CoA hydratase
MSEAILEAREGNLARITLDRPPLNILTTEMLLGLDAALRRAEQDAAVRLIRLDARGKAFSAGVDVADHVGERIAPMMRALAQLFESFDALSKPVLCVVDGAALGGGCELVLGCDLCFASDRASFGQPEIRLGLFAPPASVLLPRLVGERRALGLLLSGETLDAPSAERIGLINAVWPADRLEHEVQARIERLLGLSGAALALAKRAVRTARGLDVGPAQAAVGRLYLEELMGTADAAEGLRAFTEKRPPRWTHA